MKSYVERFEKPRPMFELAGLAACRAGSAPLPHMALEGLGARGTTRSGTQRPVVIEVMAERKELDRYPSRSPSNRQR